MSSTNTLSWPEFCAESSDFLKLSESLQDQWSWESKGSDVSQSYLKYCQKITDPITKDLIQMEYHIIYSMSYEVPVLYFQAYGSDGKMLSLQEIWNIFQSANNSQLTREDLLSTLTQMQHPVLFRPFMCLHPCRTAEVLANTPQSQNRVLTFISVMGPYVLLQLDNRYGLQ